MALVEIQINRLGINSLEYSPVSVDVSPGTALHVRITNYGSPTHITLRTEGGEYTSFTYENLYVETEAEIHIPILSSAPEGTFPIQVITGYGMRREQFKVDVILPREVPVMEENPLEAMMKEETEKAEKPTIQPPDKNLLVAIILPVIGLIFLLLWIFAIPGANTVLMAIILFVIMLIGVVVAWFTAKN